MKLSNVEFCQRNVTRPLTTVKAVKFVMLHCNIRCAVLHMLETYPAVTYRQHTIQAGHVHWFMFAVNETESPLQIRERRVV